MSQSQARRRTKPAQGLRAGYLIAAVLVVLVAGLGLLLPNRPWAQSSGTAVGTSVGNLAPDFRLVDIDGRTVTQASLVAERPGLIFFTATWCQPCVQGLRELLRFQQDAEGAPFNVLIVFVDPQETERDLRSYRERYGFPGDWSYALDRDGMLLKYNVRALDTKFVLDRQGVVRYTDMFPADYSTWEQALALVGVAPRQSGEDRAL